MEIKEIAMTKEGKLVIVYSEGALVFDAKNLKDLKELFKRQE